MINDLSIQAVKNSRFGTFQKPLYDSYCFSRIPATIQKMFGMTSSDTLPDDVVGTKEYDFIIFFLLDGFGWNLFEKHCDRFPFLQRFIQNGRVNALTSMFPSTTTCHITCLHTGLTAGYTGLYEWYTYEPTAQATIIPMRFSFATDRKINTLKDAGISPSEIFPFPSFYDSLKQSGIKSYVFQPKDITNSPYSNTLQNSAVNIGYKTLHEGLNKLRRTFNETTAEKAYFFFYYPEIDSYSHAHGPHSKQTEKELIHTFNQLEHFFQTVPKTKKNSVCIVGADHGLTYIEPKQKLFLNKLIPEIEPLLALSPKGTAIVPCGSSRDFFLHIKPECLQQAKTLIQNALSGIAEVYETKELIDKGLFGPISERFLKRVGNLVILPYTPGTVWWYDERLPQTEYLGHHGGLSADELEIPFLVLEL